MRDVRNQVDKLLQEHLTPKLKIDFHVLDDQLPDYQKQLTKLTENGSNDEVTIIFVT